MQAINRVAVLGATLWGATSCITTRLTAIQLDNEMRLEQIVQYISWYHVDSLTVDELYDLAIRGMFDLLDDRYTAYLSKHDYQRMQERLSGEYVGIGVAIRVRDSWIEVVEPVVGGPAERAGVEAGNVIMAVDGRSTEGWSAYQAASAIRGDRHTEVILTIVADSLSGARDIKVTRERRHRMSVAVVETIQPNIGYVRLASVTRSSRDELVDAIISLRFAGVSALVLDLRNNAGGVGAYAVQVASLFLNRGDVVAHERSKFTTMTHRADRDRQWADMPLVVLINENTASAAEIIVGALQDHKRGIVLGTRSFGKGVGYRMIPFASGGALAITTSRWTTPGGRDIQGSPRSGQRSRCFCRVPNASFGPSFDTTRNELDPSPGKIVPRDGGIVPDIIVESRNEDRWEQIRHALGASYKQFWRTVTDAALELRTSSRIGNGGTIDATKLTALRVRLLRDGVEMADSIWESSVRPALVDDLSEFGLQMFGRSEANTSDLRRDDQVLRAIRILDGIASQAELLERVGNKDGVPDQ